jgi:hypothetical protein
VSGQADGVLTVTAAAEVKLGAYRQDQYMARPSCGAATAGAFDPSVPNVARI